MTEERTTTYETPDGGSHTTTTIVTDAPSRSRGAGMWLVAIVLLVAVIGGLFVFSQLGGAEAAKDNAVATAAEEVGNAASQVGDAADRAADSLTGQ